MTMRTLKLVAASAVILLAGIVLADILVPGATPIAQSSTRNDASSCVNANGTGSALTATLSACGPGLYQYVTEIQTAEYAATAPAAAAAFLISTTNLNGIAIASAMQATAGTSNLQTLQPATPIKAAAANTAVTIVGPTAVSNTTLNIVACYYCAN